MMRLSSYLSIAFTALLSSAAWAADPVPAAGDVPQFSEVDRDKSGAVTLDEAVAVPGLMGNFQKLDRNGDGKLNRDEWDEYAGVISEGKPEGPESGSRETIQ